MLPAMPAAGSTSPRGADESTIPLSPVRFLLILGTGVDRRVDTGRLQRDLVTLTGAKLGAAGAATFLALVLRTTVGLTMAEIGIGSVLTGRLCETMAVAGSATEAAAGVLRVRDGGFIE
jgi:hypothetical protein